MSMVEYEFRGDEAEGDVMIEVFCNPNAYANAFQAKALITVRSQGLKMTSEGLLSGIKADVEEFMQQHG
eukprot:8053506-Pyramimonas_sp.AAC.2